MSAVRAVTFATVIGAGTVGGVFFAFSSFVMPALRRLAPAQGMSAMQSINVTAVRPPFMSVMFGTAFASLGLGVVAAIDLDRAGAGYRLIGSALYLVGCIVLTMAYHVPRNEALALLDPAEPGAAGAWDRYAGSWTLGNHVRTIACLAAAVAFLLSLVR